MRSLLIKVRSNFTKFIHSKTVFLILLVVLFLLTIVVKDIIEKTLLQ
jgi:hypothetical protein